MKRIPRILKHGLIGVLGLLLSSANAYAEVVESSDHQFKSVSKGIVNVSAKVAYEQFLAASDWWNLEHSWFGEKSSMTIEPKAGGCFCEINGDSEVEHMRVVFVQPNKEVRMSGALGPLQMMGLQGVMTWKFEEIDSGSTQISQVYVVSGHLEGGLKPLASVVDAVQSEQLMRLVSLLNQTK